MFKRNMGLSSYFESACNSCKSGGHAHFGNFFPSLATLPPPHSRRRGSFGAGQIATGCGEGAAGEASFTQSLQFATGAVREVVQHNIGIFKLFKQFLPVAVCMRIILAIGKSASF